MLMPGILPFYRPRRFLETPIRRSQEADQLLASPSQQV